MTVGFRGRKITLRGKHTRVFDMEREESRAEYYFWRQMGWDCIVDITERRDLKRKEVENENKNFEESK